LQTLHDIPTAERQDAEGEHFNAALDEAESHLNTAEGETLSIDDISDIYIQSSGASRARANMSLNTRTRTGEINDYLEVRRPFGAASQ